MGRRRPSPAPPARPRLLLLFKSRLLVLLVLLVLGLGLGTTGVNHRVLGVAAAREPRISALHPRAMADERAIRSDEEDLPPAVACGGPARAAAERVAMQRQLATSSAAHAAEQLHTTRAL